MELEGRIAIVILNRGWVYVGKIFEHKIPGKTIIENAFNVRRWGTSKGLGELAKSGPLPNTHLDETNTFIYKKGSEIGIILCNGDNWNDVIR